MKRIKPLYVFLFVNLLTLVFIVVPYFSNNLLTIDLPGHVMTVSYTKDFLLPGMQGWNPFQNLGFPQGSFYPPLMQYVIALLSSIFISVEVWIKIFFGLTLLSLPYSIYFFVKKLSSELFEKNNELLLIIVTVLTYLLFVLFPQTFGGSIKAFTEVGLVYNLFTIPLLFLFLGMVVTMFSSKVNKWYLLLASLFLASLILSHLVTGLVAALVLVLVVIYKVIKNRTLKIQELYLGVISFLLTSFYLIPYLLNGRYLTSSRVLPTPFVVGVGGIAVTLLGIIIVIGFNKFKTKLKIEKKIVYVFFVMLVLLSIIPLIDSVTSRFFTQINFRLMHPYRLLPFIFYIGLPILGVIGVQIFNKLIKENRKVIIVVLGIILVVFSIAIYKKDVGIKTVGTLDPTKLYSEYLGSNMTNIYLRENIWDYSRVAYTNPIIGKWNNFSLIAQFEESSYLNHYILSFKKAIDPSIDYNPVKKQIFIEDLTLNPAKRAFMIDLFNTTGAFVLNENDLSICKKLDKLQDITTRYYDKGSIKKRNDTLSFCKFDLNTYGDVNVYDLMGGIDVVDAKDWDKEVMNWWLDEHENLLVERETFKYNGILGKRMTLGKMDLSPQKLNWDKGFQSFSVEVPEGEDKLVIAKVQYNPRWKAYRMVGGVKEEVTVTRASPSLLAVVSSGKIYFEYTFSTFEKLLMLTSISTLLGVLIVFVVYRKRNK